MIPEARQPVKALSDRACGCACRFSAAAVVVAAGLVFVVDGRAGAAPFALPGLVAFFDGEGGDGEHDGGIGPPEAEGRVDREADEHSGGEVGAEQVLGAFACGRAGSQTLADAVLRVAELGHDDDARDREADPDPARVGVLAGDQGAGRVLRDVGGEEEEADRDESFGVSFGVF